MTTSPNFDLIDCVGSAYKRTWLERRYLLPLITVPILIKILFYYLATQHVESDDILRLGLFMLPAYFVEGWMLAHWARTILTNHRWPFVPSGDLEKDSITLKSRASGVLGGMVSFVLINFLIAGYFAFFFSYMPPDMDPNNADPKLGILAIIMLVSIFFFFRFVWSYIPLAVNFPIKKYMALTSSKGFTFNLIGLWLVCFVPPVITMQFLGSLISGMNGEADLTASQEMILIFIRVIFDTLKNILVTAGIAYALKNMLMAKK